MRLFSKLLRKREPAPAWPDLPTEGFLAGRPATREDVAAGRAAFVLQAEGVSRSRALPVTIPQYAYHVDPETGKRTPGIVIQAEEAGGQQLVALRTLDGENLVGLFQEIEFLGTDRPTV